MKPMEMIVSKCSSETLSVGVVPAPELQPGNTSGAAKSAAGAGPTEERVSRAARVGTWSSSALLGYSSTAARVFPVSPGSSIWLIIQFVAASIPVFPV